LSKKPFNYLAEKEGIFISLLRRMNIRVRERAWRQRYGEMERWRDEQMNR
jgi:hypothetical protein